MSQSSLRTKADAKTKLSFLNLLFLLLLLTFPFGRGQDKERKVDRGVWMGVADPGKNGNSGVWKSGDRAECVVGCWAAEGS